MTASSEVPPRIRQLVTELAQPQPMRRGSVSERSIKCGKPGCACNKDPKARHGPYYSLTQAVAGETPSRFPPGPTGPGGQRENAGRRKVRGTVDTFWGACKEWAATP